MNENENQTPDGNTPREVKVFTLSESDFLSFETLSQKLDELVKEHVKPE